MHQCILILLLFLIIISLDFIITTKPACSNTMELITSQGYPAKSYTVETEDGYILKIHRIVHEKSVRPPVCMLHGMFASNEVFVVRGRNKDLAFLLHDAGYDVWLPNFRGNYYSKRHRTLKNTQKEYWDFGWNEMAIYDAPAIIDKILEVTNQSKVIYIGHSMGTTVFFAMMAKRPEYSNKIAVHISLAPSVFNKNMRVVPTIRFVIDNASMLTKIMYQLRQYDSFSRLDFRVTQLLRDLCERDSLYDICLYLAFFLVGRDPYQVNKTDMLNYLCYVPSGGPVRCLIHYAQNIRSGQFLEYNYGKKENLIRYGSEFPPAYNISGINVPIYLYFGINDAVNSKKDVMTLASMLPKSNVQIYQIPYKFFNHYDFLVAVDGKILLYDKIIQDLAIY